ncbi:hypothetical protein WICMUC_005805 [Wickerhamomyces mucosus]|uniref:R3H domain-containing protein n=1 Tax=Wickerhamomyces mucosus TaxID=1378264 RepID=A0A9P8P3K1_9ASCO|nr:hypothetical protein WICMUC_005805 [Wickerhamomyces mucosus]
MSLDQKQSSVLDSKQQLPKSNLRQFPNNNPSQPVLTEALKRALCNLIDRKFVLSLENDLIQFISSNTDSYLLSPMNSYYRLLTHQTAAYYSLGHTLNNEGNSIIVFKNFGVDIVRPVPLSSFIFENQFQQPINYTHPQNAVPVGFNSHFHHPQQPAPQAFGFIPPPFSYVPPVTSQTQQSSIVQPQISITSQYDQSEEKSVQFKIMKRKETKASKSTAENGKTISKESSSHDTNEESIDESKTIEDDIASKKSAYEAARERIFQHAEQEDDDEEIEEDDNKDERDVKDIPRVIPQYGQQYIPSIIGMHPNQNTNVNLRYLQYQYNQQAFLDQTAGGYYQQQPYQYHNQGYNGFRKSKSNGYVNRKN